MKCGSDNNDKCRDKCNICLLIEAVRCYFFNETKGAGVAVKRINRIQSKHVYRM